MTTAPDKISIILYSGAFDKIHYALATASAAAAIGKQATLFFTMDACRALSAGDEWKNLAVSQGNGPAGVMEAGFEERGIGTFEDLLAACVDLGITFMVCEMGLKARDLENMTLRNDIPIQSGGLVTFLNDASKDGAILFI